MKEIDIFDSIFKEKLSSASLKAPESVWDNVSGRISAQHPTPRQHYAWWWSAAAGLCAAAAVFAVVLSGGAQKLENNEGIQQRIEILASEGDFSIFFVFLSLPALSGTLFLSMYLW